MFILNVDAMKDYRKTRNEDKIMGCVPVLFFTVYSEGERKFEFSIEN